MIETHPFGNFVPKNSKYLILGSFTGKIGDTSYDWFYSSKRNQFWRIIEAVYNLKLPHKKEKQALFSRLGIAITDIIYQCERIKGNNSDSNLVGIVYNSKAIDQILRNNKIEKIFFSSRYVEKLFKKVFKDLISKFGDIQLVTLPSPSPRYAAVSIIEKVEIYKALLPHDN